MNKSWSSVVGSIGLLGFSLSGAAVAGTPKPAPVQEPVGFVSGAVVGGFAAGPFGAVVGAGIGTWLGNRVHRAGDAKVAEASVAELMGDKNELIDTNRTLTAQLGQMSQAVEQARSAKADPGPALKGLRGDVLFRTGSFDLEPDMTQQVESLAKQESFDGVLELVQRLEIVYHQSLKQMDHLGEKAPWSRKSPPLDRADPS